MKNAGKLLLEWKAAGKQIKQDYTKLIYAAVLSPEEKQEELMNQIQARLGKSRQDQQLIEDL